MKREEYLSWNDFFMGVACLAAQRSKDPNTQVGACIVNTDKKIIGVGYNGFPIGCSDDIFPWGRTEDPLKSKDLFVVHSEANAITNCANRTELKNSFIFVTLFPCNECTKLIIQSGISKIYYLEDKYKDTSSVIAAKRMLDASNISYEKFIPEKTRIEIIFKENK
jgi:dCMP deaminase